MSAGQYDLYIEQGATFQKVITWKDSTGAAIDLTNYSARLQARKTKSSTTTFLEATTANGRITLGGVAGTITIAVPASVTTALTTYSGVYDLELESAGGVVTRLLEGDVTVSREVTRV